MTSHNPKSLTCYTAKANALDRRRRGDSESGRVRAQGDVGADQDAWSQSIFSASSATCVRLRTLSLRINAVMCALTVASAAAYLVGWLRHMSGYGEGTPPSS